jgi:hypothetical protein
MRSVTDDACGSVTAEFAMVIPAVVVVLACCLTGIQVAGQQLRLQDAAAGVARALSRGDDAAGLVGNASLTTLDRGDLVCARLSERAAGLPGTIVRIRLTATSCALADGR